MFGPLNKGASMKTFIALMLISSSVFATDFSCVLTVGEDRDVRRVTVTNDSMTEVNFGKRGEISIVASAVYDLVNVYMKVNGMTFGNSGHRDASLDVFQDRKEPVSVSCRLIEEPIGC